MSIFFTWFVFAIAVGAYGSSKGRSGFGWFLLSMLLSPLLGFIFCAVADDLKHPKETVPTEKTHVRCPDCREWVLPDARKCKHCGTALIPPLINEPVVRPSHASYETGVYLGKNWGQVVLAIVVIFVILLGAPFFLMHL